MELINDTIERYTQLFSEDPTVIATAPGRVNLIGEHTDYNRGYVLPIALDRKIHIAAGPRKDNILMMHSVDVQESVHVSLDDLKFDSSSLWSNYPKGVARLLLDKGFPVRGANLCIRGNIPIAAGLSSSAALEVASVLAFRALNAFDISMMDLISLSCRAEVEFVGVRCGIMDQFVSVMGRKDHALFLDCATLEYRHVPFPGGIRLVICDTGIRRELARSAYNQREAECDDAVRQLARLKPGIRSLRDISMQEFQQMRASLTPLAQRRAAHVIHENQRVLQSIEAMLENDLRQLGTLMVSSHVSLRDQFEVSCRELDAFVELALDSPGVYGARMTGAGFGGCAICLVEESALDPLIEHLRVAYPKAVGRSLTVYLTRPDNGARLYNPRRDLAPINVE